MVAVWYPAASIARGISNGYRGATVPYPIMPWFQGDCPVSSAARAGVQVGVLEYPCLNHTP